MTVTGLRRHGHLVFLACATTLVVLWNVGPIGSGDVWWHLRSGDLILDRGLPTVDPFSWTAAGADWQLNAWLGDVLFALTRRLGGLAALTVFTIVATAAAATGTYLLARRWGARPWPAATVTSISMALMSPFILLRPLLAGLALFPFVVLLADAALAGSGRALFGVGVLVALWANLHASFSVGVGVVGLMALGIAVARRTVKIPLIVVVTAAVAGLFTPYGVGGYLHALSVRSASATIEEWQPLDLSDARGVLVACFAVAMALAVAWSPPRRSGESDRPSSGLWSRPFWGVIPLLAALVVLSFTTIRSAAFLLVVGTAPLAVAVGGLRIPRLQNWFVPRRGAVLLGLSVAWIVVMAPLVPSLGRVGTIDVEVPVAATDAVPAGCLLLNEYEYGGLVIDRRWPDVLVSQDGRNDLYGSELLEREESILGGTSPAAVDGFGAGCALLRADRPLVSALEADDGWNRVATDRGAVLFVRSG